MAFLVFLGIAAWQDLRERAVSAELLSAGAFAGGILAAAGERELLSLLLSMGVGAFLLFLGKITGGVGEGDGWFFVVSGLFWDFQKNILLLLSGLFFCSLYCLVFTVISAAGGAGREIRRKQVPFLPFLVPMALWLGVTV